MAESLASSWLCIAWGWGGYGHGNRISRRFHFGRGVPARKELACPVTVDTECFVGQTPWVSEVTLRSFIGGYDPSFLATLRSVCCFATFWCPGNRCVSLRNHSPIWLVCCFAKLINQSNGVAKGSINQLYHEAFGAYHVLYSLGNQQNLTLRTLHSAGPLDFMV